MAATFAPVPFIAHLTPIEREALVGQALAQSTALRRAAIAAAWDAAGRLLHRLALVR